MKYVMFLRGVNVGGIKVPMGELKDCLNYLGLNEVKTFLQTGNVTFHSDKPARELKQIVEEKLRSHFKYTAIVFLYPAGILKDLIEQYPFKPSENRHRYAIFCENEAVIDKLISHRSELDASIEDIAKGNNVVYWTVPQGSTLKTTFSKIISKPAYKSSTTNRNLNTLEKMIQ
jgi:uncharacterized protein (DUF1697 family)